MKQTADRYGTLPPLLDRLAPGDISEAIARLRDEQPEQAARILRNRVLERNPDHGVANAVLGFALQLAGLPGSADCFNRVLAVSLDPVSRAAALEGLLYVECGPRPVCA